MNKYSYVGKSTEEILDMEVLSMVRWRERDVVISGFPKSGTNWLQNIVYQLHSGTDTSFENIRTVVPVFGHTKPGMTRSEELALFEACPSPRALKTHFGPPILPFRPDIKYLVAVRNIMDIPYSLMKFENSFSEALRKFWGVPVYHSLYEVMEDYDDFINHFHFLVSWLSYRQQPNVMFVHFHDIKKDTPNTIREIAKFIDVDVSDGDVFARVCHYCSFEWMKRHQDKFELMPDGTRLVAQGHMVRQGQVGDNAKELPRDIAERLKRAQRRILPEEFHSWAMFGGNLP